MSHVTADVVNCVTYSCDGNIKLLSKVDVKDTVDLLQGLIPLKTFLAKTEGSGNDTKLFNIFNPTLVTVVGSPMSRTLAPGNSMNVFSNCNSN